ncbi:MAG: FTR1 family iron permease [Treponema sp.]|nr:FTR1 family iron permease [Treponema sp.]
MRKAAAIAMLFCLLCGSYSFADTGPWESVEADMRLVTSEAYYRYVAGDTEGARALVDRAYNEYYRGEFERNVKSVISEARARNIDDWFEYVKTSLSGGKTQQEIRNDINQLNHLLRVTAGVLDGKEEPLASTRSWTKTAEEMAAVLDRALDKYRAGDAKGAVEEVDVAYFQFYEKVGFEKTVMTRISGSRASTVEYQFSTVKKAINRGASENDVRDGLATLAAYLREDAEQLDAKSGGALGAFLGALLIILREGFEAIIIVGAIIAYLVKSGNKKSVKPVYWGSLIALVFSAVMAFLLNLLVGASSGRNQEIIEGATMLLAVLVLFYVSNWMVSKAEAEAWSKFIEGKVQNSIARGSMFSLAFAAFLAVFREGAEIILFYQALLAGNRDFTGMIWLGFGIGCVLLVVVYILIRFLSIRLPLKPFFLGTSVLLFVMSISFLGNGIKELQEGNVVGVTTIQGMGTVDILGIYPTLETLIPQLALLAITVTVFVFQIRKKGRRGISKVTNSGLVA